LCRFYSGPDKSPVADNIFEFPSLNQIMNGTERMPSSIGDDVFVSSDQRAPVSSRRFDVVAADNAVQHYVRAISTATNKNSVTTFREISLSSSVV